MPASDSCNAANTVHGLQVFWTWFLARADAYEMGIPAVPLRELYAGSGLRGVSIRLRCPVDRVQIPQEAC